MVSAAVVDTDVYSHLYVLRNSADPRVRGWRAALTGTRVLISFQTRAELLGGALARNWGSARIAALRGTLDRTPTIRADDEVVDAHARLFAECRRAGHAIHGKQHTADRWIAASAIAKNLDLLAGDLIYEGAPGLRLLTH